MSFDFMDLLGNKNKYLLHYIVFHPLPSEGCALYMTIYSHQRVRSAAAL